MLAIICFLYQDEEEAVYHLLLILCQDSNIMGHFTLFFCFWNNLGYVGIGKGSDAGIDKANCKEMEKKGLVDCSVMCFLDCVESAE